MRFNKFKNRLKKKFSKIKEMKSYCKDQNGIK